MPLSDPTDVLLAHDEWATRVLLESCQGLSNEQLDRPFEMGLGTLRKTLVHMLGAERGWTGMLAGVEPSTAMDKDVYSIAELLDLHAAVHRDFAAVVREHPPGDIAGAERGGRAYAFPRGGVLAHVTTHAVHHRAQCVNMLRQMGVDPLPEVSIVHWMRTEDPAN